MIDAISEKLTQYLNHDSSVIIFVTDRNGVVVKSNDFASSLIGKNSVGLNINDIFINFEKPFNILELINYETEKILINITNSSGMPGTWYFKFYDLGPTILAVGEANSLEIELLRKNILEMNQELGNISRELQKKNSELKKLNELKNHFLGMASHDLRNPLGVITGYCEFLLEDLKPYALKNTLPVDTIMMVESIYTSGKFMLNLINDLLDISTIESGKFKLELVKADLIELIKKNIQYNNVISQKKKINIQLEYQDNIPEILIDSKKIEQVLNNIISNALKFSHPDSNVFVKVFQQNSDVVVSVSDEGQGIPETEMNKLFKEFERTSVQSTAGEKSTGLGLSIARKLILAHNGKIWVESKVRAGSTFYFSLPI